MENQVQLNEMKLPEGEIKQQTPVQQLVESTIPPKPKKAFKKWVLVAIIFVVIIGLSTGGYFFNKNSTGKTTLPPSPTPIKQTDSTTNWKTYNSNDGTLSFKYPNGWEISKMAKQFPADNQDLYILESPNFSGQIKQIGGAYTAVKGIHVSISLQKNKNFKTYDDYINFKEKNGILDGFFKKEVIIVDNVKILLLTQNTKLNTPDYDYINALAYAYINGRTVDLELVSNKNVENIELFNQILSTFKFTDQTTSTSTLKPTSLTTTKNGTGVTNAPSQVVNDLYSAWTDCLDKQFSSDNTGPSPFQCPSLSTYPELSQELISKLNNASFYDPILCAQNTPTSFKVDTAIISEDNASTTVHTFYTSSGDNPIHISLNLTNNKWLITDITCTNGMGN